MQRSNVKAIVFDVFGTVVDWRGSTIAELTRFARGRGLDARLEAFADDWRGLYQPGMEEVRSGRRPSTILDDLHRESLLKLLDKYGIAGLAPHEIEHLVPDLASPAALAGHVEGLTRLGSALHHRHAVERQRRAADAAREVRSACRGT